MATYFDILPEDILVVLLKKDKILRDVNLIFRKIYDVTLKLIKDGLVNPADFFVYENDTRLRIETYCGDLGLIKFIDGAENNSITSDLVETSINNYISKGLIKVYLNEESYNYDGYVYFICEMNNDTYFDLMKTFNIVVSDTTSKKFYMYINVEYNSIGGSLSLYTHSNWKNFWNMKLDNISRSSMMGINHWITRGDFINESCYHKYMYNILNKICEK